MDTITIIGLFAATFTTISLVPQFIKSVKSRNDPTTDKTMVAFAGLFCIGIFLWLIYGIYLMDLPMMVANSLGFLQGLIILSIQLRRLKLNRYL
jgi:MtN3 and saliva related transmembrane protein